MKKLICIILAICAAVSLTACGGKTLEETAAGFKPARRGIQAGSRHQYKLQHHGSWKL